MAHAEPWAEAGDLQLRSDIDLLAGAGVIDNITMQWPLPWAGVLYRLDDDDLSGQPAYIADAAARVRTRAQFETHAGNPRLAISTDLTTAPAVVRGFDALGRQKAQGQAIVDYVTDSTAIALHLGGRAARGSDRQALDADGSFIAQRLGNAMIYGGYVTHWWGPGWISALSLSNNARPVPQIGIARVDTAPFDTPWLSWLGPWQMEAFLGILDGPRIARHTIYDGFRFAFSPLPHLEIGLSRTDEMCGSGHPCKPLVNYFNLSNQPNAQNNVNDEGTMDARYSGTIGSLAFELYAQAMNEDTNPFVHSGTSHLAGASLWSPISGGVARLTVEYASSLATNDLWGGDLQHGLSYNSFQYADGMRYRGRTLGFSLDSDSRLFSVQASFSDALQRSLTLTFHRADISDPLNRGGNVVSASPVSLNLVEVRSSIPVPLSTRLIRFDIAGRWQDDQPRPDRGMKISLEIAVFLGF